MLRLSSASISIFQYFSYIVLSGPLKYVWLRKRLVEAADLM